jgi:hypothetical protein
MIVDSEASFCSDTLLPAFNFLIKKFFKMTALKTDQVIVMLPGIEFIYRFVAVKMVADQQARLFKLGEYTINRCQANIDIVCNQHAVNVFGSKMLLGTVLEQFQYFKAWQGGFQARAL